jgi:hypothetical protein
MHRRNLLEFEKKKETTTKIQNNNLKINFIKKKTSSLIYPFIAMGFLFMLTNGCKKDDDNILPIQFNPDLSYETTTDIEGNVYRTIKIGIQTWMAENLKMTRYRNGDAIPNVTNSSEWFNLTTGASCDYENTASNSTIYGKLYAFASRQYNYKLSCIKGSASAVRQDGHPHL